MEKYDTWLKVGEHFRCGCCMRMPIYVDIHDLMVCPHCLHIMKWYETDHGTFPLKMQKGDEKHDEQEE